MIRIFTNTITTTTTVGSSVSDSLIKRCCKKKQVIICTKERGGNEIQEYFFSSQYLESCALHKISTAQSRFRRLHLTLQTLLLLFLLLLGLLIISTTTTTASRLDTLHNRPIVVPTDLGRCGGFGSTKVIIQCSRDDGGTWEDISTELLLLLKVPLVLESMLFEHEHLLATHVFLLQLVLLLLDVLLLGHLVLVDLLFHVVLHLHLESFLGLECPVVQLVVIIDGLGCEGVLLEGW